MGDGVRIGPGTSIVCTGELDIADHVLTNARVSIYCAKQIVIGRDALISWDVTLVDNDFHKLYDADKNWINPPAPIIIGERAWIGFGATIAKDNFGSFTAVRTGMQAARGEFIAVMAADLQEPPELMVAFFNSLASGNDVAVGTRSTRDDPAVSQFSARVFWRLYRWLVQPEIPASGVDVFAVSRRARDALLQLDEAHSSLVAQLFWIGFPRAEVPYERRVRKYGSSGWTFRGKAKYLLDSIFSFTAIPITLLMMIGFAGTIGFMLLGIALMAARALNVIAVPGYTAIMVTILFSASLILLGLGIVGSYVWRAYENTKRRPLGLVRARAQFNPSSHG